MSGLEELRRLETAATAGPWRYNPRKVWYQDKGKLAAARMGNPFITGGEEFVGAGPDDGSNETTIGIATTGPADNPESMANAEFIAAARNQLPRILDALDAVMAQCDYWETLADGDRYYAGRIRAAITTALEAEQ